MYIEIPNKIKQNKNDKDQDVGWLSKQNFSWF